MVFYAYMEKLIKTTVIAITFILAGTTVYAAGVASIKNKWGQITTPDQTTEIYRLHDMENKVVCYYSYIKGNANSTPSVDCVKL